VDGSDRTARAEAGAVDLTWLIVHADQRRECDADVDPIGGLGAAPPVISAAETARSTRASARRWSAVRPSACRDSRCFRSACRGRLGHIPPNRVEAVHEFRSGQRVKARARNVSVAVASALHPYAALVNLVLAPILNDGGDDPVHCLVEASGEFWDDKADSVRQHFVLDRGDLLRRKPDECIERSAGVTHGQLPGLQQLERVRQIVDESYRVGDAITGGARWRCNAAPTS